MDNHRDRGQSEPLGVMLLLGIVMLGLVSLGVVGGASFQETKADISVRVIQHEFSTLAADIDAVAFGDTPVKTTSLELDTAGDRGGTTVREHAGALTVRVGETTVYAGELGLIEYETVGIRVAYQAGGIWRDTRSGRTEMLHPPPFSYRNRSTATLTLPIIVVEGTSGLDDGVTIEARRTHRPYPSVRIPTNGTAVIMIQSRYYDAWGRYLTDVLGVPETDVTTDDATERVTIVYGERGEAYLHLSIYHVSVSDR